MDDCKGVCYELATQDSSECLAHDIGRAFLGLLGWAQAALVLACVVLAFGAKVPKAYALSAKSSPEMVIDGNFVGDDEGSKGYMCAYCSPYTATLELIGHYGDLIQIDQEKYAWLVGGNNPFSAAMDRWQELTGASNEEPENTWLGDDGFIDGWLIISGKGNTWYGTFTDRQIQMAEIAFNSIMDGGTGEEGGGGDSGGSQTSPTSNVMQAYRWNSGYDGIYIGDVRYYVNNNPLTPSEMVVTFNSSISSFISSKNGYDVLVTLNSGWNTLYIILAPQGYYTLNYRTVSYSGGTNDVPVSVTIQGTYYLAGVRYDSSSCTIENDVARYAMPDADVTFAERSSGGEGFSNIAYFTSTNPTINPEPETPDVPAPDPPKEKPDVDAPTPPKLPDPKDPIVPRQPTKPGTPTIDPHIDLPDITVVTQPTNTTPQDYTPWLRAIFEELKAMHEDLGDWLQEIVDEMANHCQHLRDEMSVQATYLGECLESVQDEVQNAAISLSNSLGDYSEWLAEYLDQWGEWLVEHLDFNNEVTVDPYDDTSLMYWIRRIYTKLGGSNNPVNTRPTDPVTNPNDTGNWLNELWETILRELAQLFPNLMIDLGLIFDDLKSKFPFSIPWDIHALLLLLVTEPVAPHFTIPMYALSTDYELEVVGEYDIDLSFYTDYLMGVHLMLEIAWIGYMLKHTKDYMELIEAVIPS